VYSQSWLPKGFEFLSGLPELERKARRLMPIQVFIDDSGGKGHPGYLVLLGLVDAAEKWASFSDEWQRRLQASPPIRYFKFSEARGLSGEFQYWREAAVREKLESLKSLVEMQFPKAVCCAVDTHAFEEQFRPLLSMVRRPKPNVFTQPYLFAAMHLFNAIYDECGMSGERIELMFDEHDIFKREAKRQYEFLRKGATEAFKEVMPLEPWFRDDKDFMPLQAADLSAAVFRNSLNNRIGIHPKRHLFCGMLMRFSASRHSYVFSREELISFSSDIEQMLRKQIEEENENNGGG